MKKLFLVTLVMGMLVMSVSAKSLPPKVYYEESTIKRKMDEIYESNQVNAYKFVLENVSDKNYVDMIFYIDDMVDFVDNQLIEVSNNTEYFVIGTTINSFKIRGGGTGFRPSFESIRNGIIKDSFYDVLQHPTYIRIDKDEAMDYDLIMRFEAEVEGQVYRIDIIWHDKAMYEPEKK